MKKVVIAVSVLFLCGCTHQISIKPSQMQFNSGKKINSECGLVFSPSDTERLYKETGAGGDSYEYKAYSDLKFSYNVMLRQICDGTRNFDSHDAAINQASPVVFMPEIKEVRSKAGFFTWPPTEFYLSVRTKIFDATGEQLQLLNSTGKGNMTLMEMQGNFGSAGGQAVRNVLIDVMESIDYEKINQRTAVSNIVN